MRKSIVVLLGLMLITAACGGDDNNSENNGREPQARTPSEVNNATITPGRVTTSEPSPTPVETTNLPGIELVNGFPDTCEVTESYADLLGFDVIYHDLTTANFVETTLKYPDENILSFNTAPGENRDGAEGWGIYPEAYSVPDSTEIRVDIKVYLEEGGRLTSESTLYYNCTTGETVRTEYHPSED